MILFLKYNIRIRNVLKLCNVIKLMIEVEINFKLFFFVVEVLVSVGLLLIGIYVLEFELLFDCGYIDFKLFNVIVVNLVSERNILF